MTNNNWIESFWDYIENGVFSFDDDGMKKVEQFIKQELTKKDQEHKAELEIIKGEVQKLLEKLPELESDEYDAGLFDMKHLVLSILDSHINKLSTE